MGEQRGSPKGLRAAGLKSLKTKPERLPSNISACHLGPNPQLAQTRVALQKSASIYDRSGSGPVVMQKSWFVHRQLLLGLQPRRQEADVTCVMVSKTIPYFFLNNFLNQYYYSCLFRSCTACMLTGVFYKQVP